MEQESTEMATTLGFESEQPAGMTELEAAYRREDRRSESASEYGTGPTVGVLFGLDEQGGPLVVFGGALGRMPMTARSVLPLSGADVGRQVVLLFERGDAARPLVMGVLQTPRRNSVRIETDAEKLVFTADREIVLRCGESSITLTRAGKVLIQGAYIVTKASGMNRIKGASVQIN
jgi:hypothetical protein